MAYSGHQYRQGLQVWNSPEVLPWQAWLAREQAGSSSARRALTGIEQWLLWRAAVSAAGGDDGVLLPLSLVDAVRRSSELMDDWGIIGLRVAPTEEAELLLRARSQYAASRAALPAGDEQLWRTSSTPFSHPVWLLGFDSLGSATAAALQRRGARVEAPAELAEHHDVAGVRVCVADNAEDEFERVAAWCRAHLLRDGTARLLVVIPSLARHEAQVRRAFSESLESANLLATAEGAPLFAFEGGAPLRSYPMVEAALCILKLQSERLQFAELGTLLRSSYLGLGGRGQRVRLELWLRDHNVTSADRGDLRRLCQSGALVTDPALRAALEQLLDRYAQAPVARTAADWARHFASLLQSAEWPGALTLSAAEQQVRARFEELLGEFATLVDAAGLLAASDAIALFGAWVQRASLEPASGDVPVTVTEALGDPLVPYDGIWVCGLSADVWPQAPAPDAFVPFPLLRAAGVTSVTAAGQLLRARAAMAAWRRCAGELVYSWHRQREDALLEPSPLLPAATPVGAMQRLRDGLMSLCVPTEAGGPDIARPWPSGQRARGGTQLLQAQSNCPFRATAEWRLGCTAMPAPAAGIDARAHGQILHAALETIWRRLGDSATLQQQAPPALHGLVTDAVAAAVAKARSRLWLPVPEPLWRVEQQRCVAVLEALLEQECQRGAFAVEQIEQRLDVTIGGLPIELRLDRLDRMPGVAGMEPGTVLIDYKSGRAASVDWLSDRPGQMQLLAYASGMDSELRALCTLHLPPSGITWSGVSDVAGRVLKLTPAEELGRNWTELRQFWQQRVAHVAGEFVGGVATVDPQPDACRHCHLQLLCRIDATSAVDATGDEVNDE